MNNSFNPQLIKHVIIGTKSQSRRKIFKLMNFRFQYRSPNINEKKVLAKGNVIIILFLFFLESSVAFALAIFKASYLLFFKFFSVFSFIFADRY